MYYFVIGFLLLCALLFSSYKVAKKEGKHRGILFFFIQLSSATVMFHEFLSYNIFLFGILCGVGSMIGYALTFDSLQKKLGALGLILVGYFAIVYFSPYLIPEPTYTLEEMEETYESLRQQVIEVDYESPDQSFREISSTSTRITFMELEMDRSQNHLSRLLSSHSHLNKGEQQRLEKIRFEHTILVEEFIDEAMDEVFEAHDGSFLFEEINPGECHHLDGLLICQNEERYEINLEEESSVSRTGLSRYSLFDYYYFINSESEQYYLKLGDNYTIQEDQLESDYDGMPYTINGGISLYRY